MVHLNSLDDFLNIDSKTEAYKAFTAKMASMTSEIHVCFGEEIR